MKPDVASYLAEIGRRGGQKSRRTLDAETARSRSMVRAREAGRAYRRFHAACFWSFGPDYRIRAADVSWVVRQLRKHGGHEAWAVAGVLCR